MSEVKKIPTSEFNPGYGCAILVIMVLTFAGIVTWMIYSGIEQDRQIATFTTENAPPLPVMVVSEGEKAALKSKLVVFAESAVKGDAAQLLLNTSEANALLLLAADAGIGEDKDSLSYREMLRFTGFDSKTPFVNGNLRMPVNKLPWAGGDKRYLVGSASFKPVVENGSFSLKIEAITVPGKTVSEGFVNNMKNMDWLSLAKQKDAKIADALKKVTACHVTKDGEALILECTKASPPNAKP
jgi:hypothetical protein